MWWLGKDSDKENLEERFEEVKELIKSEESGGCSKKKAKDLQESSFVRGMERGASVVGAQLKSEGTFIAIHSD